jgi:hypothetical protein
MRTLKNRGGKPMKVKQITLTVKIPENLKEFNQFEEWLFEITRKIAAEITQHWCERIETLLLRKRSKGVRKEKRIRRYLETRVGVIEIWRYKVSAPVGGEGRRRYYFLLDRHIGLEKVTAVARGLKKKAVELATDHTYRESRDILRGSSAGASHTRIHKWVQQEGKKAVKQEERKTREAFEGGKEIEPKEQKTVVAAEIDATYISSNEGRGKHHCVKLGIIYTGKEDKGRNGTTKRGRRRRRLELRGKVLAGGIEEVEEFGRKFWYKAENCYGVSRAEHVLYQGDGDRWIRDIRQEHFEGSHYQLDLWHLQERIGLFVGMRNRPEGLYKHIYSNRINVLIKKLDGVKAADKEKRDDLIQYIENNRSGIMSFRKLKVKYPDIDRKMLNSGSGAIEKNIEINIGRRFKKRGMHWSKEGANRLLKLRLLKQEPEEWDKFWRG